MPEITTEDFMFASEFFLVNSLPPDFESWPDNQLDDYLTNNASEMVETHSPDFIWENIETLARGAVRYAGSRVDTQLKQLLKLAYLDINYLLIEGFDTNVQECEMDGVKDTIKEIEEVIGKEN